jgi:hypothetical protein
MEIFSPIIDEFSLEQEVKNISIKMIILNIVNFKPINITKKERND